MRLKFLTLTVAAALTSGPALAYELTTPPPFQHPYPQGVPRLVVGAMPQPVIQLRYGIIGGKRVLFEPTTLRVVYILQP
jgi:hypothetical protein